jgi:proline iminopeptidase
MSFGLSDEIRETFQRVFDGFPEIEQVPILGSRAKGGFRDGSDIDLAVFAPSMVDCRFTQLWQAIDDLPLVFKVELLHWDRLANNALCERIVLDGRPFSPLPLLGPGLPSSMLPQSRGLHAFGTRTAGRMPPFRALRAKRLSSNVRNSEQ